MFYEHSKSIQSSTIFRLGSDPGKLFPYAMFQRHLQQYAQIGLAHAPVLCTRIFSSWNKNWDELSENFNQNQEVPDHFFHQNDTSFENVDKRLRDIVIDMIRLEYI